MTFLEIWAIACAFILVYVTIMWLLSLMYGAGVLDSVWGPGFAVAAVTYFVLADGYGPRKLLVTALYVVWGLRLSSYMLYRNRVSDGRSSNYLKMRKRVGRAFWWKSFYRVSLPQTALIALLSTPALLAESGATPRHLTLLDLLGALVWLAGFVCEAVGDAQLLRFKRDPANAGRLLRTGLWAYSRHPNLFGDATLWWGFFLIALGTPYGWTTNHDLRLAVHDLQPAQGIRRRPPGKEAGREQVWLRGVHAEHARVRAVVPKPARF